MPTYYYDDNNKLEEDKAKHKKTFQAELNKLVASKKDNAAIVTQERYDTMIHIIREANNIQEPSLLKVFLEHESTNNGYSTDIMTRWIKEYDTFTVANTTTVINKMTPDVNGTVPSLEDMRIVSHTGRMFEDIYNIHVSEGNDHPKGG